ncbi:MAG: glycosyltransferase [Devosia sp.]
MSVRIAAFTMSDPNHFSGLHSVTAELLGAGAEVKVWTHTRFQTQLEAIGAGFADIFRDRPLDAVDDTSRPLPSRFVTFAAVHARAIIAEVASCRPDLVLYDGFALIGRLVAEALDVPAIIVTSGHAIDARMFRERLAEDPRVHTDARCLAAVERLKSEFNIADASPFSYVADPSPWLNVHIEPEQWLTEDEKRRLGPMAYFGSLSGAAMAKPSRASRGGAAPRLYVSFGTIVWRYWTAEALSALAAIAEGIGRVPGAGAVITLGGADVPQDVVASLARPGVSVVPFADQWATLSTSDIFITHQGIGSTHEAVALGVPMLSYPFFWDQPALAARAQEFGLALPLLAGRVGPDNALTADAVEAGIAAIEAKRLSMEPAFAEARRWEEGAVANRPAIALRIIALAR